MNTFQIIKNHASHMRDFFIDLLFPLYCLGCQKENTLLCDTCLDSIQINKNFFCPICKRANQDGSLCLSCQTKCELDGLWISAIYASPLLSLSIKKYKYLFQKDLSLPLSTLMLKFIKENNLKKSPVLKRADLFIAVPLHWRRQNFRGFNQAELLASNLSVHLGVHLDMFLMRSKNIKAQAKLSREERIKNVENVFKWQGSRLNNKNIILIDDVTSTGATLNECAGELKKHGAKSIWGFVLASN